MYPLLTVFKMRKRRSLGANSVVIVMLLQTAVSQLYQADDVKTSYVANNLLRAIQSNLRDTEISWNSDQEIEEISSSAFAANGGSKDAESIYLADELLQRQEGHSSVFRDHSEHYRKFHPPIEAWPIETNDERQNVDAQAQLSFPPANVEVERVPHEAEALRSKLRVPIAAAKGLVYTEHTDTTPQLLPQADASHPAILQYNPNSIRSSYAGSSRKTKNMEDDVATNFWAIESQDVTHPNQALSIKERSSASYSDQLLNIEEATLNLHQTGPSNADFSTAAATPIIQSYSLRSPLKPESSSTSHGIYNQERPTTEPQKISEANPLPWQLEGVNEQIKADFIKEISRSLPEIVLPILDWNNADPSAFVELNLLRSSQPRNTSGKTLVINFIDDQKLNNNNDDDAERPRSSPEQEMVIPQLGSHSMSYRSDAVLPLARPYDEPKELGTFSAVNSDTVKLDSMHNTSTQDPHTIKDASDFNVVDADQMKQDSSTNYLLFMTDPLDEIDINSEALPQFLVGDVPYRNLKPSSQFAFSSDNIESVSKKN